MTSVEARLEAIEGLLEKLVELLEEQNLLLSTPETEEPEKEEWE